MKILALESSAKAASVALVHDGILLAQYYQNCGLTHSRTLMPMVENLLTNCELLLKDIDCIAVAVGPGSFTGLRIGISTAKGLAFADGKPCCPISTLEAMAWQASYFDGIICTCMDARRKQVYNALFACSNGNIQRMCSDRAISLDELLADLSKTEKKILLVGDGAVLCYNHFAEHGLDCMLAPENLRSQSAYGVAAAAENYLKNFPPVTAQDVKAHYLRLSQAERERLERLGQNDI